MSGISKARKEVILRKMLAPYPISIRQLALQENLSEATLYNWRNQLLQKGHPACPSIIAVMKTSLPKPALLWLLTPTKN
ncbi:MAG: hypothetical protein RL571_1192 [Pseudomonadota bacterium]|jgi:transposase-like protein